MYITTCMQHHTYKNQSIVKAKWGPKNPNFILEISALFRISFNM